MGGMAIAGAGALAGAGASIFGAGKQASAAKESAQMQAMMGMLAMQQQAQQYAQTRNDLAPYRGAGEAGANMLMSRLPYLSSGFTPDQQTLENTPGYQWNLSQGTKATQSAAAARGLGVSGAALKGAATYATGLADNTLKTQYDIDQGNKTNAYNKLSDATKIGASAAGATGMFGANSANQQTNLLTGMGNAYGAANMTGANAFSNALTGGANALAGFGQLYNHNRLTGGGGGGGMYGGNGGGFDIFGGSGKWGFDFS